MHLQVEIYLLQNNMFFPAVSCGNIWISSCHLIRTAILIMKARRSNGRFIFAAGTPIHGKTVFILKRARGLDPECMFVSPFPCWTMGSACLKTGLQVPWVLAPPDVSTESCFVHITCISLHMFSDNSYNRHIYIYIYSLYIAFHQPKSWSTHWVSTIQIYSYKIIIIPILSCTNTSKSRVTLQIWALVGRETRSTGNEALRWPCISH